ncbi:MarR family transcriptional regulator [Halobacteriales archaeon Cl-PHB]
MSAVSPTTSTTAPTLSELGEDPEPDAIGEYEVLDYPDPIEHGFGIEAVLNDINDADGSAYRRLFDAWQAKVGDREHEPYVVLEDVHQRWDWLHDDYPAHLVLKSKGWKAGRDAVDGDLVGQYYEYSLQVMRYDPDSGDLDCSLRAPTSCQVYVQPQDTSLSLPSGDSLTCHYGEGTKFRTQTTYAGPSEALSRTVQVVSAALEALGFDRPAWETMNRDSWRVWKGEVHHRLDEELMSVVAQKLRSARTLVEHGGSGDSEGGGTYSGGKHVEERVVSDMWDRIGFAGHAGRDGFNLGLKVYRVSGQPADERLKHPKLEAFFAGTSGDTRLPHADDWSVLRATLRQLASAFGIRSGVSLGKLRADDYYDPEERDLVDVIVPQGWRQAMREANEERERRILHTTYEALSLAKWDVLWVVQATEGCTYETLAEYTGYSQDYVREVVASLEDQDILRRRTYPRVVVYHNEELRLNAREKLQEVEPDRGLDDIREDAEERRELRRERRESDDDPSDAESDGASEDSTSDGESSTWRRFGDVNLSGEQLGRDLDGGHIEPDHVKIRTDPYAFIGPPDG